MDDLPPLGYLVLQLLYLNRSGLNQDQLRDEIEILKLEHGSIENAIKAIKLIIERKINEKKL